MSNKRITLRKGSVVRYADTAESLARLKKMGYEEVGSKPEADNKPEADEDPDGKQEADEKPEVDEKSNGSRRSKK